RAQPFFRRSEGSPSSRCRRFSKSVRENKSGCPIFHVLWERACPELVEGWEPRTPVAPVLTFTLHVWSGHSCPLPLTLILFLGGEIRIRVCPQAYRKPDPTVEERRFSAA